MKKFHIKDENGKEYSVEETDEVVETEETEPTKDADEALNFTEDEISALKKLIPIADKLVALLEVEKQEHDVDKDDEADIGDEDEDDEEETLVDTDEDVDCNKMHDSKKSAGAIEKQSVVNDSVDVQDEIANAWAKRYNGGKA